MSIIYVCIVYQSNILLCEVNNDSSNEMPSKVKRFVVNIMKPRISLKEGKDSLYAIKENLIFACGCRGGVLEDKAFRFLSEVSVKFYQTFCDGISSKFSQVYNEKRSIIQENFSPKILIIIDSYSTQIKMNKISQAIDKIKEAKVMIQN